MTSIFHRIVDFLLSWISLAQNSQYGWKSVVRKTGEVVHEQQPLKKKIKLLLLFNPIMEWLDRTHAMRLYIHRESDRAGREERAASSKSQIAGFVDAYNINMKDFDPPNIDAYGSFRRLLHAPAHARAVVVADSRVVVYDSVAKTKALWIKGQDFDMTNLVMDTQLGARFDGAAVASFRLSPQDYHRYHPPVAGRVTAFRSLPGDYYQVDPIALRSNVDILTRNARDYVVIDTKEFGEVLFVAIGATDVGSVQFHKEWRTPGNEIRKGDELGIFQFGGSSIIVAFQAGRIKFDDDLRDLSMQRIQVAVEVGMSLGSAV
ncbi:phosphatidylserine decarboxylase proenzyme [Xylaria palmicola]|nr:phosphatidylserine decarboxylase proenzyme [Xylaria palmicola]